MCQLNDTLKSPWVDDVSAWLRCALLAWILGCGVWFVVVKPIAAQQVSQDVLGERVAVLQTTVTAMQAQRLDARMSVIEDTVVEVKWLGRTVLAALLLQLLARMKDQALKRSQRSETMTCARPWRRSWPTS